MQEEEEEEDDDDDDADDELVATSDMGLVPRPRMRLFVSSILCIIFL